MARFFAELPISPTELEDLAFLVDPTGVVFSDQGTGNFEAESGAVRAEVAGSGLSYIGGVPSSGTITEIKIFKSGESAYKINKLDVDIAALLSAPDLAAAIAEIFAGNDKFVGSNGDDTFAGGEGNDKLNGRDGDDTLFGQGGKDTFDGGEGSDIHDGGSGKDTYVFKDAPDSGVDTIVSFKKGETMKLGGNDFDGLNKGKLDADAFVVGAKAKDAQDRIIYDKTTGEVFHDKDGKGGADQTLFAQLPANLSKFDEGSIIVV